ALQRWGIDLHPQGLQYVLFALQGVSELHFSHDVRNHDSPLLRTEKELTLRVPHIRSHFSATKMHHFTSFAISKLFHYGCRGERSYCIHKLLLLFACTFMSQFHCTPKLSP